MVFRFKAQGSSLGELLRPVGWVPMRSLEGSRGKAKGGNLLPGAVGLSMFPAFIPCCGALFGLCICLGQPSFFSPLCTLLLENTQSSRLPYARGQQRFNFGRQAVWKAGLLPAALPATCSLLHLAPSLLPSSFLYSLILCVEY